MIDEDDIKHHWNHWCEWMADNYNNERLSNNKEGYIMTTKESVTVGIGLTAKGRQTLAKLLANNLNDKCLKALLSAWEADIQFNVHELCTGDLEIGGFYSDTGNPFTYRFSGEEVETQVEEIDE